MITRILSSKAQSITGAAIILGGASLVSRIIGVARDRLLAHYFGAGQVLDAYYAAFRIPDFIFNSLLVGALTVGFIPIFLSVWNKNEGEAWRLTNSIINLVALTMFTVSGCLMIIAPYATRFLAPGFSGETQELTTTLTRIMLVSPILLGISGVVSSVLHSFRNFLVFSLAPIIYNLGIIIGIIFLVPIFGPSGLAWGVVLGAFCHLLIQLPTLAQHGYHYRLWLIFNHDVQKMIKLVIPRALGLVAHQFNLLATTVIASTLTVGSVAIFNFANNLQYVPIGLIGHSFSLATFPALAKFVADGKRAQMVEQFSRTVGQILFLIVPLTLIFLLLPAQITRVVLGSGEFDWSATTRTIATLKFFSLSLFAQCLVLLVARAFYALQDTWTPFFVSFGGVVIHITASLLLKNTFNVEGLALAYSLSTSAQLAVLWLILRHKVGGLNERILLKSLFKISIAAFCMGITIQFSKYPLASIVDMTRFWGVLSQGAASGIIGLVVYALACHILRLEEIEMFRLSLTRRWLRLWNVRESIDSK